MARSKTVALIFGEFGHPIQPYLKNWALGLGEYEYNIELFTLSYDHCDFHKEISLLSSSGISDAAKRLFYYTVKYPKVFNNWLKKENFTINLKNRLRVWSDYAPLFVKNPEITHLVNSYTYSKLSKILGSISTKSIISFRGYDTVVRPLSDKLWKENLAEIYGSIDILHFVSFYLQKEALQLGAPENKCRVIYPGVDVNYFKSNKISKAIFENHTINLVTTGRLVWQKGYIYMIQAVKKLLKQNYNVKYNIVGIGPDYEFLLFYTKMLGIEKHVCFHGLKTQEEVKSILDNSDIYIHPSLTEAIPLAIMEALSMSLPVIATGVGGITELVENGRNGILVSACAPKELSTAVIELIEDPIKSIDLGNKGREVICEKFSLEKEIQNWISLYQNLCH